ncbi:hypothetical protein WOLCODRAFT_160478 [Wolfiporia cocos MD-104 SS10]|uniref:Hemimethylated DNA-binding domain-containing protein n=1 Tax=Wolfiporia cocos (strain MD-104) TaxID=742152 RepID=A0A2H3IVD0_WOLCO|nr:hypothetical protein WOLCODRAFT_160478 [Wolfiporia cocos MD-104 SS10]
MSFYWPWLPTELIVYILSLLPAKRDHVDSSVKTLLSCLAANSHLRAAASTPKLWEAHYVTRYTECVEEREAARRARARGDWCVLYRERRILDKEALELVDEIRLRLGGRHQSARRLVSSYSFDVWDALELESELPLPMSLCPQVDVHNVLGEVHCVDVGNVPHALPRRYWARAIMGVIARHHVLKMWQTVYAPHDTASPEEPSEPITFEQALAGLSAFFDKSPKQIYAWLDQLAQRCKHKLIDDGVELDMQSHHYDLRTLCIRLRAVLHSMGFRNVEVGDDFYKILNQFPHALMHEEHRRTIPMSLVYIFSAVARRLGVRASPTNYPSKVMCHIAPIEPASHEMLFDIVGDSPPFMFRSRDLPSMLRELDLPEDASPDIIRPCSVGTILQRAANNIIVCVRWSQRYSQGYFTEKHAWCTYAASCILLLRLQNAQMLPQIMDSKPLDALAVLRDALCPAVGPLTRTVMEAHSMNLVQTDEEFAQTVWNRQTHPNICYFVGLVVQHKSTEYKGCIIGWHPFSYTREGLMATMERQRLERGWEQPFYWIITEDGLKKYVAEEDLVPIPLAIDIPRRTFESRTIFGRFFEGFHTDEKRQRGRCLPSQELQALFPDDNAVGADWIANGLFGGAS